MHKLHKTTMYHTMLRLAHATLSITTIDAATITTVTDVNITTGAAYTGVRSQQACKLHHRA